jgi:ATP-binding cassette, subfamily B, heavy metal transporter
MHQEIKDYKVDYKYNWKVYWSIISSHKPLMLLILLLILLLEATKIFSDYLFKFVTDNATEYYNNSIGRQEFVSILLIIAAAFIANILFRALVKWWHIYSLNIFETKIILELKQKFFNHLTGLSYNFHTSTRTGSLISKLIRGGSAIERMTDVFIFNMAPLLFQLLLTVASLAYFEPTSAIVIVCVVSAFVGYSIIIHKFQERANTFYNETEDFEKANLSDLFTNFESIKYFGKEEEVKSKYAVLSDETGKAMLKYWDYYKLLDAGHMLILGLGTLLMVYFPLSKFLNAEISLGTVIFVYTTYGGLFGHMYGFVHGIRGYYRAMSDFESLFKFYKLENEIKDVPDANDLLVQDGRVEFKNVTFKYKERQILKEFSLSIPKNKRVALVGPSGSGKSTIIRLLYRLYDVNSGKIFIDGQDISKVKHRSLRRELSIVPQECVLFDDTIYNNISFSRPDASRDEVLQAIKFAQLDRIIGKFPKKEATIVGERGCQ